jgi:hypothetical protein
VGGGGVGGNDGLGQVGEEEAVLRGVEEPGGKEGAD